MQTLPYDCVACGNAAHYTVLLALGYDEGAVRYYIPNQHARSEQGTGIDPVSAVPFCNDCMNPVEEGMRNAIAGLQQRHGVPRQRFPE